MQPQLNSPLNFTVYEWEGSLGSRGILAGCEGHGAPVGREFACCYAPPPPAESAAFKKLGLSQVAAYRPACVLVGWCRTAACAPLSVLSAALPGWPFSPARAVWGGGTHWDQITYTLLNKPLSEGFCWTLGHGFLRFPEQLLSLVALTESCTHGKIGVPCKQPAAMIRGRAVRGGL